MGAPFRLACRRALWGAAVLLLGAGGAWADKAVLLSSTAPGYSPGMVVATNERFPLPDGASATLLFRSGQMLRLRGPFEGSLQTSNGDSSVTALAEAFRIQGVDAAVIGGTRTIGPSTRRLGVATDVLRSVVGHRLAWPPGRRGGALRLASAWNPAGDFLAIGYGANRVAVGRCN
jgi:hypothetical protein